MVILTVDLYEQVKERSWPSILRLRVIIVPRYIDHCIYPYVADLPVA